MKYLFLLCLLFIGCSKGVVVENQGYETHIDTTYIYTYKLVRVHTSYKTTDIIHTKNKYSVGDTIILDDGSY